MAKKNRFIILLAGFLFSAVLLTVFALSKNYNLLYLELPEAWFFVSALPVLLALLISGFIKKATFAGVELESELGDFSNLIISKNSNGATVKGDIQKRGIFELSRMSLKKKSSLRILTFYSDERYDYNGEAIREYFRQLPNLKYFCIIRDRGKNQYVLVEALKSRWLERHFDLTMNLFNEFVNVMYEGNVATRYEQEASELSVRESQTIEEVIKLMRKSDVRFAGVFSDEGVFIGVVEASQIEREITSNYLKLI